jgi:hypothetical protein
MTASMSYTADEFGRESQHLETLTWEALCIERDATILFAGYGPEAHWVKRAIAAGATVDVIEHREAQIKRFGNLPAKLVRGSTSVIPAKENAYDVAVSIHYLHETDPFFHAQIVSELARVARRVAIVEPSPPTDPLGKRIALLYSQAKRELGQFEYYQPIEYWKKLLQAVKADVSQHVFAFSKVPPREYLADTVALLLDTMEVEEVPAQYLEELRAIAKRPGSMLLPQARYVLVGATIGELPEPSFSRRGAGPPVPAASEAAPAPVATPSPARPKAPVAPPTVYEKPVTRDAGYEFPPVDVPEPPAAEPAEPAGFGVPSAAATPAAPPDFGIPMEPPPAFVPGLPFGAPTPPDVAPLGEQPEPPPFGAPFAMPEMEQPPGAWQWEPPDPGEEPEP